MPDPQPEPPHFDACLDAVLHQEGGFADNPHDPGGATNLGITRATLARWRKIAPWWKLPVAEVKGLAKPEAAGIYQALYWNRCRAGDLPPGLDLAVFDYAVNSGPDRAVKALQQTLKVAPDGFVGPLTLDAIKAHVAVVGAAGLIVALCNGRLSFLQRLAIGTTFGAGWSRRVAEIRAEALAMAGAPPSSPPKKGTTPMNILAGYKTYIVGAAMLIAGIAQLVGVALPALGSQSAGDLLMQGLAVIFLRQGITNTVAKS
jgi:lysozyme family protein